MKQQKNQFANLCIYQNAFCVQRIFQIDFHQHTEEEAWNMLMETVTSGAHSATVITGASGILKPKFQQWMTESVLSPHIISFKPLNNGSFEIKIRKQSKEG